jgi:Tol biopolymer transport system component
MARKLGVLLAIVLLAGIALLPGPAPARATAPGPNGRITFTRYNPAVDDGAIYTANPDGTDVIEIYPGPAEAPRWSPDGSRLAFACYQGNFEFVRNCTMNPDGSGLVQLFLDTTLNQGVGGWSPDGTRLAFEGWDDVHPEDTPGVFTMRAADGGDLTRVTTNPYGDHDIPIDYAPDGSRLLFGRGDAMHSRMALFVVNVDGSGLRQLTPWGLDADWDAGRWSPDGRQIVFSAKGAIFLINQDGSGLVKIHQDTQNGFSFAPAWAPDGTRILFADRVVYHPHRSGQEDLYTMNPDGSGILQVTNTPVRESWPDWGAYQP